jgi:hypothetical protein
VTLRAQPGNGRGGLEALTVEYATQDPTRFARPEGFRDMQIPSAAQAGPAVGVQVLVGEGGVHGPEQVAAWHGALRERKR